MLILKCVALASSHLSQTDPPFLYPSRPSLCQVAEGALFSLHHLHASRSCYSVPTSLYPSLPWQHRLQEAKLHWGRGERNLALSQLRSLLQTIKAVSFNNNMLHGWFLRLAYAFMVGGTVVLPILRCHVARIESPFLYSWHCAAGQC